MVVPLPGIGMQRFRDVGLPVLAVREGVVAQEFVVVGARDVLLVQQGVERDEQVQVGRGQLSERLHDY